MFSKRLEEYRIKLHLKKKEMADSLDISESYYSLIENGKRNPSKAVIEKLVVISELPEEYWIYGIDKDNYIDVRDDFKSLKKALDTVAEWTSLTESSQIFDNDNNPKDPIGKLLISAFRADLDHILAKRNK